MVRKNENPGCRKRESYGGFKGWRGGVFSPTPTAPAQNQIKKIWIDLSELPLVQKKITAKYCVTA